MRGRRAWLLLLVLASLSLLGYAALWANQSLRRAPAAVTTYLQLYGGLFALYLLACWLILRYASQLPLRATLGLILAVALAARLLLVFAMPTLSDDVYRYIWDGRVQAAGFSPYAYPPAAPQLAGLRSVGADAGFYWRNVNRKEAITIYPAGAQLLFAGIYHLQPDSLRFTKAVMAVADFASVIVLMLILTRLGQPSSRAVVYAWSPLPIIEAGSSGHLEPVLVLFTLLAVLAVLSNFDQLKSRQRTGMSSKLIKPPKPAIHVVAACFLALAALVKLIPLLLLGGWVRSAGWRFAAVCLAFFTSVYYGFILTGGGSSTNFLNTYLGAEFYNAPLYQLLAHNPTPIFGLSDGAIRIGLLLTTGLTAAIILALPERGPHAFIGKSAMLIMAYLGFATSVHPWYAIWLLAFLPMLLPPAGLPLLGSRSTDEASGWRRGYYGLAVGALLYTGLVFFGYTNFALGVLPVPVPVLLVQLGGLLLPGLLWLLLARRRLQPTNA